MSRTFVISAEGGIVAGIVLAFYLVPGSTPVTAFWFIAALFFLGMNGFMLASALRARKGFKN